MSEIELDRCRHCGGPLAAHISTSIPPYRCDMPSELYGHFPGGDPRLFRPDRESCLPEEIAAWEKACEEAKDSEAKAKLPVPVFLSVYHDGLCVVHQSSFGIGTYTMEPTYFEPERKAMTLRELMEESYRTACDKGWWDSGDRNLGELIALMHTELSEAFEEVRHGHTPQEIYFRDTDVGSKPEGVPVELADLLIRVFDFCEHYHVPLEEALEKKLAYNRLRPHRHGGKKA